MPGLGNLAGPAIGAGSQLVGGFMNSLSQGSQNRRSERFALNMYERQKADQWFAWHAQNEYNSPQAQMKRFQEAGLNPHLIYGQGNSGNASPLPTPDVQSPQYRSPEWGGGMQSAGLAFMNALYDLDIKQAQVDNYRLQNTVLQEEALLKRITTDRKRFDFQFESDLAPVSAEARREMLRQVRVGTDLSISRDAREAASNSSYLQEAAERMANMRIQRAHTKEQIGEIRERVTQMKKDGTLKDLDIELKRMGINPNDPTWMRFTGRVLENLFGGNSPSKPASIWQLLFGK